MARSIDNVNHQTAGRGRARDGATPAGAAGEAAGGARGEADVLELVHDVMHRFRALQYQQLRDGPHDITHMEFKVLWFFARHPGATQSELAEHSGRDKAQLARLIKRLLEIGLLAREADADDRRQQRLTLTEAGRAVQRNLQQQRQRLGRSAVAGFDAAELTQLRGLLQRLQQNLAGPDEGG